MCEVVIPSKIKNTPHLLAALIIASRDVKASSTRIPRCYGECRCERERRENERQEEKDQKGHENAIHENFSNGGTGNEGEKKGQRRDDQEDRRPAVGPKERHTRLSYFDILSALQDFIMHTTRLKTFEGI